MNPDRTKRNTKSAEAENLNVSEAALTRNRVDTISKASKAAEGAAKGGPNAAAAALKGRINRVMKKVDPPKGNTYDAAALKKKRGSVNDGPAKMVLKPKAESILRAIRVMEEAKLTSKRAAVIQKADRAATADMKAGMTKVDGGMEGDYESPGKDMLKTAKGLALKQRVNRVMSKVGKKRKSKES
jgi:hypothetical protein